MNKLYYWGLTVVVVLVFISFQRREEGYTLTIKSKWGGVGIDGQNLPGGEEERIFSIEVGDYIDHSLEKWKNGKNKEKDGLKLVSAENGVLSYESNDGMTQSTILKSIEVVKLKENKVTFKTYECRNHGSTSQEYFISLKYGESYEYVGSMAIDGYTYTYAVKFDKP